MITTKEQLRDVQKQIKAARATLRLLEAREFALGLAHGRDKAEILAMAARRRESAAECRRRSENASKTLRGQDKGMVSGAWSGDADLHDGRADALEAIANEM